MFEGIKSKLGFGETTDGYGSRGYDARYEQDDDYGDYDEEYDDYEGDYEDDDPDADLNGPVTGSRYEPYSTVTTRPSRTSSTYSASSRSSSSRSYSASSPRLVSIEDVRAQTQVPESLMRDPLPQRRSSSSSSYRAERTMVDSSDPTRPASTTTSAPSPRERSESLNALFTPTTTPAASAASSSYDPYEAYAGSGSTKHDPTRSLTVLKPISYGEAERVAKSLKAGDAVVLALGTTPDALAKRLLDFSFGVASALDASVDCIADKVFVLTRGGGLTDAEKVSLRKMNVL